MLLAYEDYERMVSIEDEYWLSQATKANKEGYIGTKASEKLLDEILNTKD